MYYDPFANLNPDLIKPFQPAEKPEPRAFDPAATEFQPAGQGGTQGGEEGGGEALWQVVAAEAGGKAVAVLVHEGNIFACSSPFFHSKCSHPGLPCMDWQSVVLEVDKETRDTSLASDSPPPDGMQNFTDSGFENGYETGFDTFTENSSEQSCDNLLMAEGQYVDLEADSYAGQYAAYPPVYGAHPEALPQGYTTSLPEAIALAPDTIVVEHYPQPVVVAETWTHDHASPVSWSAGLGLNIQTAGTFPEPVGAFPEQGPLSPSGQTQFINLGGLGADMGALHLGRRREKSEEGKLQAMEEQRKREEFKNKILYNLAGTSAEREEMKIKDSFKDQVLSNLRKDQQQKESDEEKVKRAFKDKILSNINGDVKS
jgi:hypothetical protein